VLGGAAGSGLSEWRCSCARCRTSHAAASLAEAPAPRSVAVSADGVRWFLLDVSPELAEEDVAEQLAPTDALRLGVAEQDDVAARASAIVGAVLTNGALESSLGWLALAGRSTPLCLYATRETYAGVVVQNAVFRTLERRRPPAVYRALALDVFLPLRDASGEAIGLSICAFPVAGEVPLHLRSFIEPTEETNVGLIVRDDKTGARFVYVAGAASLAGLAERARDASCMFLGGTFWSEAELTESPWGSPHGIARDVAVEPRVARAPGAHGTGRRELSL
jgi:pyrroloquinoline quinone biosynthesis protein B